MRSVTTAAAFQRIIPILGGTFDGPRLRGSMFAGTLTAGEPGAVRLRAEYRDVGRSLQRATFPHVKLVTPTGGSCECGPLLDEH
jgi:hypothetical protein